MGGRLVKKAERKRCFVVGPIGADDSEDRIHADWLLEEIIQPVFEEHFKDFDVTRADKISDPGRIDAQVISSLLDSELVIADLTTLNPNAFYEIGIRHTVQKPIIHMHLEGERIPFDIASFRSIKFDRKRPKDLRAARDALKASIAAALDDAHEVDNPVTFARGRVEFDKTATPAQRVVQEQLEAMMDRLDALERPPISDGRNLSGVLSRSSPSASASIWANQVLAKTYALEITMMGIKNEADQLKFRTTAELILTGVGYAMNAQEFGKLEIRLNRNTSMEKISELVEGFEKHRMGVRFVMGDW